MQSIGQFGITITLSNLATSFATMLFPGNAWILGLV
jgi:hypothetical protein